MDLFGLKPLLISALIFIPLERLLTLRPQKIFRRGIVNDLVYATIVAAAVDLLLGMTALPFISAVASLMPVSVTQAVGGQPLWLQVLEIIVLTDFGVYLVHRAFHTVPFLWRFHSIHHSVAEMDWLAGFHNHPFEAVVTKALTLIPVFVAGFSIEAISLYFLIFTGQNLLIHSNVRLDFGPLKWLIVSPQFHHWHHADERAAYDKNFAGQIALFDVLFGTYRVPSSTPAKYGVDDPIPANFFGQLGYPFVPRRLLAKRPSSSDI